MSIRAYIYINNRRVLYSTTYSRFTNDVGNWIIYKSNAAFPRAIRIISRLLTGELYRTTALENWWMPSVGRCFTRGDNPGDLLHPASSRNLLAEGRRILRIIPTEYRLIGKRRMSRDEPGSGGNLQNSRSLRCVRRLRAISNRRSDRI